MFQHYSEGDRIITNEPCLNCTCHDSMLMCFLKVCPFAKPIGQDCQIEKRPPKLDLDIYPYLPRANVATTSPASYLSLMTEGQS